MVDQPSVVLRKKKTCFFVITKKAKRREMKHGFKETERWSNIYDSQAENRQVHEIISSLGRIPQNSHDYVNVGIMGIPSAGRSTRMFTTSFNRGLRTGLTKKPLVN